MQIPAERAGTGNFLRLQKMILEKHFFHFAVSIL